MKICIIGAFDFVGLDTGGQPVKSRELFNLIKEHFGDDQVNYLETYRWKKRLFYFVPRLVQNVCSSDTFIMLPAQNGVNVFSLILYLLKKRKRKCKIFYSVIGGWLPEKISGNPKLKKYLLVFDGIWVETSLMKITLDSMGFCNVSIVPNFKRLTVLRYEDLPNVLTQPLKLCTFSRVMEEKGIEDAINAVKKINSRYRKTVFTLDIFGHIADSYKDSFHELMSTFPEYIKYKGVVMPSDSVSVLQKYFCLLFPTRFFTEGLPGTIIDAYASGLPIITALWKNYEEIFIESVTGWGYEFGNTQALIGLLEKAAFNPVEFSRMRKNCLLEAERFRPESVINLITAVMNFDNGN
jgi:glycosyltransferase involved in cell wall biosynthesis